jgi:hypothetical protein
MNARLTSVRMIAGIAMALVLFNAIRSAYRSYSPWTSCVEFYRRELQRQQAFASIPVWQLIAALIVIAWLAPSALRQHGSGLIRFFFPAVLAAATGLILLMAVRKFQARSIQTDLEALNDFENENPGGSDAAEN